MEDTTFLEGANLAGITTLMNNLHINEQANLEELEKQVMGKQQSFPTDHFDEELNGLAKSLGINFNDPEFSLDSPHSVISKKPSGRGRDKVHGGIRRDSVCTDSICSDSICSDSVCSGSIRSGSIRSGSIRNGSIRSGSVRDDSVRSGKTRRGLACNSSSRNDRGYSLSTHRKKYAESEASQKTAFSKRDRKNHYAESEYSEKSIKPSTKQVDRLINHLRSNGDPNSFYKKDHDYERKTKLVKLEKINMLLTYLGNEQISTDDIKIPTIDSSMQEIDDVIEMLTLRNVGIRYSSIAEEILIGLARGLEIVFDGTREIPFLNYRPDYTGLHNTFMIKLFKMRYETSQVVGNLVQNMSPLSKICLELGPSLLLYPALIRTKHKASEDLYNLLQKGPEDPFTAYNEIHETLKKNNK
ncbi:pB407L [African swine fever virus]|uniref:PB407L n=2 Tax=African swine fever virus TaxID=10497 RepID=A9JLX4_ASFPP|nr:pB407L [African swine fever virus]YP_009703692.1 pB407L [African swine fever virus OURT 88/3]AIY22434.1 pB407L [African swine fever virus]UEN73094.1 B407L [African swine fever virus]UEN73252.1 B407L [African swine fever virus]CAN10434.1 pB407L [African swine fever virus OURT 88/3]